MPVTLRWSKPTIRGESIMLRPMTGDDTDAVWEMVNDPFGNDLTATTSSFTYEQIQEWCVTRQHQDLRIDLAIVDALTGEVVGEVVLNEYDPTDESANFRIALRNPSCFGHGLGTEATQLIVEHGLGEIGLRRIHLGVLARNPRAIRVYEKSGFRRIGEMEQDGERWIEMEICKP